ncbi:hypothetical protein NA8A_23003 [Nitratireductor indicus C115]|uniref:Helix-turn-helix domain-containing protein n=1 Tax=Nitratireductor indicus C115 TaxID=1231190 RepID=K2MXQ0_9HYPH|nr:helix-turn-helix domain-containing protein [Nitratireductor indicus]EKF40018.1 hypothetical protein NA8A_23003 [Nitratireductor indicus C115]SFQ79976.1 DNA binding domain-containing protein, excisionase family [Nitratireductor indicus]
MSDSSEPHVYTPRTLAEYWGCSERHVRNLTKSGELRSFRIGKLIRVRSDWALDFQKAQEIGLPNRNAPTTGASLNDFTIGTEFRTGVGCFRCTDIGTRCVIAIRIDQVEVVSANKTGTIAKKTIDGKSAEAQGWFNGPPYQVVEIVFDENDLEGCELIQS